MEWIRPRQAQQASRSFQLRPKAAFVPSLPSLPSLCHYPHSWDWLWSIRFWTVCPSPQLCVRWLLHLLRHWSLATSTHFQSVFLGVCTSRTEISRMESEVISTSGRGREHEACYCNSSRHATHDPAGRPSPSWFGCTAECTGGVFAWQPGENYWAQVLRCLNYLEAGACERRLRSKTSCSHLLYHIRRMWLCHALSVHSRLICATIQISAAQLLQSSQRLHSCMAYVNVQLSYSGKTHTRWVLQEDITNSSCTCRNPISVGIL